MFITEHSLAAFGGLDLLHIVTSSAVQRGKEQGKGRDAGSRGIFYNLLHSSLVFQYQKKKILFKCNTHKPEIKSSHLRSEEIEMQRKVDEGKQWKGDKRRRREVNTTMIHFRHV